MSQINREIGNQARKEPAFVKWVIVSLALGLLVISFKSASKYPEFSRSIYASASEEVAGLAEETEKTEVNIVTLEEKEEMEEMEPIVVLQDIGAMVVKYGVDLEKICNDEADFLKLPRNVGRMLISTESQWDPYAVNGNPGSIDHGAVQLNTKGVGGAYVGRTVKLSTGELVKVTRDNWKSNVRLNVNIGFRAFKEYMIKAQGNLFVAYSMYNCGESTLRLYKGQNLKTLTLKKTCEILSGNRKKQGANNLRKNFYPNYLKYLND